MWNLYQLHNSYTILLILMIALLDMGYTLLFLLENLFQQDTMYMDLLQKKLVQENMDHMLFVNH